MLSSSAKFKPSMGQIIAFPLERVRASRTLHTPCTIVILPSIRYEYHAELPAIKKRKRA